MAPIQIYQKGATGEDNAIRLIQGNRTRLADPHGIAFDPKTRLVVRGELRNRAGRSAGHGPADAQPAEHVTQGRPRRPNWPAGNGGPGNGGRREVIFGTGKFGPPSITVHAA